MLSLVFVRSLISCANNPLGVLREPLDYDEVAYVCSKLKLAVTGRCIDYEHIRFAGPQLWRLLFELYQNFSANGSVCESLKTGVILPLFKGKGAKANNKDNYRGITLFPSLYKIYEMVLLNRLENYAEQNRLFSNLQFGFQVGVGCTEASFTILESINHILERGSKVFGCFLMSIKLSIQFGLTAYCINYLRSLTRGRMWLAIKDLYTEVRGQVLYSNTLSRKFDISQGTSQGRILAPFMYKVYIYSLLNELTNHCYAISINQLSLTSPSFADDIALLALNPTFLTSLIGMCYKYSTKWRYEFNPTESGFVTYGETKPVHFEEMKEREWILGDGTVDEPYEYKNLGVLKNYIGSFSSNVEDNIDKTRKKAGMVFSSNFDRRKVNPFVYIKFWGQACLPSLLYGSELFTLTSPLLAKLEQCQQWFLNNIFYVPNFTPIRLILKLSGLNSVDSEIDLRKLLFLGRMITEN